MTTEMKIDSKNEEENKLRDDNGTSGVIKRDFGQLCRKQVQTFNDAPDTISTSLESSKESLARRAERNDAPTCEVLDPYIKSLMDTTNIDINQAKTLVYYCIMSWAPDDKLSIKPLLLLTGESGTGKNKSMEIMYPWCRHNNESREWPPAEWINADRMRETQLRNALANTATAFVEEADKAEPLEQCEGWYKTRYDISSKKKQYGRQVETTWGKTVKNVNRVEVGNHFGFTVLHAQNPFISPELSRRTITISIIKNEKRKYRQVKYPFSNKFIEIACSLTDWDSEIEKPYSNSAWDIWEPWLRIAMAINDKDFINYIYSQIEAKQEEDETNKLFEPKYIVMSEIIPIYFSQLKADLKPGSTKRIFITELAKQTYQRNPTLKEKQIAGIARNLGFQIYKPGGKTAIVVESQERLVEIASKVGVDLTDIDDN